jgi:PIN like domain
MLQQRSIKRADLVKDLKSALEDPASHFFADTSFVMAAACLNTSARGELHAWVTELSNARFHIPAWVAHECYGKINSDLTPLKPMEKAASDLLNAVNAVQIEARRFIDDNRAKRFDDKTGGPQDRLGFLAAMDREVARLVARGHFLRTSSKDVLEETSRFLVQLVNDHVLDSDIYSNLPTVEAEHAVRLMGQHPPGYLDKKKEQNRYGDLIIWQEIVRHARKNRIKSVVLCTNDNKQDWVYIPPTVIDENGKHLSNEARQTFKVILPLPLLLHEIRVHNESARLTIVNLGMLATTLHQELGRACPNLFAAYQPTAQITPDQDQLAPLTEVEASPEAVEEARPDVPPQQVPDDVLPDIRSKNADLAASAVQRARQLLLFGADDEFAVQLARALVEAASGGLEASSLLIRDIISRQMAIDASLRILLIGSMLRALYFESEGRLRDKPLEGALTDLFSVQSQPEMRSIIDALDGMLGSYKSHFLLSPEISAPRASLTVAGDRSDGGGIRINSILNGEHPLLQDVGPGSARSLAAIFGKGSATADEFRVVLARYFRVPTAQLDLNLIRSLRVSWDDLTGFVQWGARTPTTLR